MALTLTLNLNDKVFVADYALTLEKVSSEQIVLRGDDGHEWVVTDDKATEIAPNVMVHVGLDNEFPDMIGFKSGVPSTRLVFMAPRHIPILREGVYLKGRTHAGNNSHDST